MQWYYLMKLTEFGKPNAIRKIDSFLDNYLHLNEYIKGKKEKKKEVYIYIRVYVYIHMFMCICIYIYLYVYVYFCVYTHTIGLYKE